MELQPVRHLWGMTDPWEVTFPKIKAAGYDMIELYEPTWPEAKQRKLIELAGQQGFSIMLQGLTVGRSVAEHLASFRGFADAAKAIGATVLNVHSGSDAFSNAEADAFYREIVAMERDLPFTVVHETHRGRVFFNPWRTRDVLLAFPSIKLCCDFSHWVCVAERLEWDDEAGSIVKLCAERAGHVHTRVGYDEGPQVPDPSAPEYKPHLDKHFEWWNVIWNAQAARGLGRSTFTPEFGPAGYLHTIPHTNVPVADQWTVCEWMKAEVLRRYSK